MSLFNTHTTQNYSKTTRVNNVHGSRKQPIKWKIKKHSEYKIIKGIEDRVITEVKNLFEQEEDYWKPVRVGNFYSNKYISNMKVMVI